MNQKKLEKFEAETAIFHLKKRLREKNYSQSTIARLDSVWRNFTLYWKSQSQAEFSTQLMQEFINFRYGFTLGDKDKAHNVSRAMNMLWDFVWFDDVFKQSTLTAQGFSDGYKASFEAFLGSLAKKGYAEGSIRTFTSSLARFESYCMGKGITGIDKLTASQLSRYIETMSRFAPRTIERNLRLIKRALDFAYGNGFMSEELAHIIPKVRAARNLYLPTIFTHEEINRLLNAVDRSNPLGKRDYAMLSIAAGLGLRVSDIVGLTFSEIDWKKRNLTICQQKTSKIVSLPLPDEIGWAIIDYLQNGRPQSNSCRVFIKHCAPYDELSFQVMNKKLHSYLHMAEIKCQAGKHAGMHSFRHSLASSMLEHETPLHVITGALGQTLEHSTETYLSIDIPHLRLCALEVTE